MSNLNIPAYLELESTIDGVLDAADAGILENIEADWIDQAAQSAAPSDLVNEVTEWRQWTSSSPAYRLAAYYDDFSSAQAEIPAALLEISDWRDTASLQPLLEKVAMSLPSAPSTGTGGQTQTGTGGGSSLGAQVQSSSMGGLGLLLIAGALLMFLGGGKK